MNTDQEEKFSLADEWLASAEVLADFIKRSYPYEFFLPGRMDRLEEALSISRGNLEANMPEAALVTSQQIVSKLSETRIDLERKQNEWQLYYYAAWDGVCRLHAEILANQSVCAIDLDGNCLESTLNVDEWSSGAWTALFDNIQQLLASFESDECTFETAGLRQIIEKELPFYASELENMIRQTRLAALNSQLRINIADLVVQALKEQGFSLEDAGYDNVDMRQGYGARLVNYEGGEVLVQVRQPGLPWVKMSCT